MKEKNEEEKSETFRTALFLFLTFVAYPKKSLVNFVQCKERL